MLFDSVKMNPFNDLVFRNTLLLQFTKNKDYIMPIKITIAKTPELIDEVFKIRHQIFVEEEGFMKDTLDKRLIDRFDAYPTTTNLVLKDDEKVVGSLRMTLDSAVGTSADEHYDFRKHLPQDSRVMLCSMYCVSHDYRKSKVILGLLIMAGYFAESKAATHLLAPINPTIAKRLLMNPVIAKHLLRIGFQNIGDVCTEPQTGEVMQPLLMDVRNMNDFFLDFVKKNQIQSFLNEYERIFYKQGEYIVRTGEVGECAFFLIEGTAQVKLPNSDQTIAELKQGEFFGELALLTDDIRSADIVAATEVQVMTISKSVFMERFLHEPEQALGLMKLIGDRAKKMIHSFDAKSNIS